MAFETKYVLKRLQEQFITEFLTGSYDVEEIAMYLQTKNVFPQTDVDRIRGTVSPSRKQYTVLKATFMLRKRR